MKRIVVLLLLAAVLTAMVTMSKEVTAAANAGIQLCLQVVIPSLFPFFVICTYMNSTISRNELRLLRPLGRFCRIPKGTESILLMGFIGGYPIGAQCVTQSYECKILSKNEAERMLGFCNNAGPAFIFGMLSICFPEKYMLWLLWFVQIVSSLLTAHLIPGGSNNVTKRNLEHKHISLPLAVQRSIHAIAAVCGWVVLFKIILCVVFENFTTVPQWVLLPLTGILELINGCTNLISVDEIGLRFILASALLSFGGICVHMQTFSVTNGLQKSIYIIAKVLQTTISIAISTILQLAILPKGIRFIPSVIQLCIILIVPFIPLLVFFRKSSRFSAQSVIQYKKSR